MEISKIILIVIGGIMIIFGLLPFINKELYIRIIKWSNDISGTKTKITKRTLLWGKISGILTAIFFTLIIFGLFIPDKQSKPKIEFPYIPQQLADDVVSRINSERLSHNLNIFVINNNLCMYIEKRMSEIANDYDDGEGYLRDKSDRRVIDEYFVGLADVQEMYRPLSEDTDLEDIVNSSTLHENSLFMSPEHTQFCYKATHKGIIFLLEKDEN